MNLPFSLRHQFLNKGYAIVPNVMSTSTSRALRTAALEATQHRSQYFAELPTLETVLRERGTSSDLHEGAAESYAEKRNTLLRGYRALKRQRRRNIKVVKEFLGGRKKEDLTGDDLWRLSELLAKVASAPPRARHSTSRVDNDAQMLRAINTYRCNAWMTSPELRRVLFANEGLLADLAQLAEEIGGVEKAVVFADAPLLREAYGNPVYYHCTAPQIGTQTNVRMKRGGVPAVTLLLLTFTPSDLCLAPHVLENSHTFVQEQYGRQVDPASLQAPFLPMESHIPNMLRHFYFDHSVVGTAVADPSLVEGAVMVINPHLLMAFEANLTPRAEVIYRLHVINEDAVPYLQAPSWIQGWQTGAREVNFASPAVFPPLYTSTTCSQ